jgi:uncharacterized protein
MSQAGVIDSLRFASAALELRGRVKMQELSRLAQMQGSTEGLEYHLRGGKADDGKPCLRISVRGCVQLPCQRCLEPFPIPIAIEAELLLAGTLREISEADDDIDRVLASRCMDIGQLVEDEMILALPMVPRHASCGRAFPAT